MITRICLHIVLFWMLIAIGEFSFSAKLQELPEPLPVAELGPVNVRWKPDNEVLVFQESLSLPTDGWDWYRYSLKAGELVSTSNVMYPSEAFIERRLDQQVRASVPASENLLAISVSPSQHYAMYVEPTGEEIVTSVGQFPSFRPILVNLRTWEYIQLHDMIVTAIPNVLWSEDETGFAIVNFALDFRGEYAYITSYTDDLINVVSFRLDVIHVGENERLIDRVFDISADGSTLLLSIQGDTQTSNQLYLYDGQLPANSRVIIDDLDTPILAASFSPYNENRIWFLSESGLSEYDLENQALIILYDGLIPPSDLPGSYVSAMTFSPDGRYLTAYGTDTYGFYLIDLFQYMNVPDRNLALRSLYTGESTPSRLRLQPLIDTCTALQDQVSTLGWSIFNPNQQTISVTWRWRFGTLIETGTIEVPGARNDLVGVANFETPARIGGSNNVQILVEGVFHDTRECVVPRNP